MNGADIDGSLYSDVTGFAQHTGWLHPLMSAYTSGGIVLLAALLAAGWWSARRNADRAAMAAVAWTAIGAAIAVALGLTLKQVFAEPRPCLALPHTVTVQACPGASDYSFPSDHTTIAAALAAGLWLINRKLGAIAAALALVEGFSRVYLGQHYPHDIAAALLLAALVLLAGWPLARRPLGRLLGRLETTPLRPLLTSTP